MVLWFLEKHLTQNRNFSQVLAACLVKEDGQITTAIQVFVLTYMSYDD